MNRTETETPQDLGDRLLAYATRIVRLSENLGKTFAQQHIAKQILRSDTSPMAHHAEAQSAESNADFIHKLMISLKELRETHRWLQLIQQVPLVQNSENLNSLIDETDQLERVLNASISTVKSRHRK